jgi:hypothetical protein
MIKNRIASTAALATFGLAALGGIALAAPGNADTGASSPSSSSSATSGPSGTSSGAGGSAQSSSARILERMNTLRDQTRESLTDLKTDPGRDAPADMFEIQLKLAQVQQQQDLIGRVVQKAESSQNTLMKGQ